MRSQIIYTTLLVTCLSLGCAHSKLHKRTNSQFTTLTDIYEKQVLDNIALFCVNPDATPFFARVTGGVVGVNDTLSSPTSVGWNASGFSSASLSPMGSRGFVNNWSVTPIDNAGRLKLMRCAYRKAVGISVCGDIDCSNCCALATAWHRPSELDDQCTTEVKKEDGETVSVNCNVTCSPGCGWFCVGNKKDVPKDCCSPVGEYCGKYVWVKPQRREDLHRLTMLIIHYATGEAYSKPTSEVVRKWTYDDNGVRILELTSKSNETTESLRKMLDPGVTKQIDAKQKELSKIQSEILDEIVKLQNEQEKMDDPSRRVQIESLKQEMERAKREALRLRLRSIETEQALEVPLPTLIPDTGSQFRQSPRPSFEPGLFFQGTQR